ncbi:hypothetical protein LCGC14_2183110 [marine sediment metagenome]|uniref:4Fe-4S ferredoxin-type domain-containing protein n=1 Tax=marine sediment metagenome TaxID=412755 RepID=A0A0F9E8R3_9ZZZZ
MTVPQEPLRIGVGLCAGLERPQGGLDPEAVARLLERSDPGVQAEVMPDICRKPEQVPDLASRTGARRLVIALCEGKPPVHEFQSWTRKAGLDPYAVELIDLTRWIDGDGASPKDEDDAILVLKAAIARLRAFEGSEPEQLKLRFLDRGGAVSRRSLMTMPPWTYEAVPAIDQRSCLGKDRCGLCVPACPFEAIGAGVGISVDKSQCEACGICLTTCPADAVRWPGSSLAQYEAELAALLAAPRASIVFTCRRATAALDDDHDGGSPFPPGWLPVEVPCMGMVTPGWILQALAGGAERVALVGCGYGCGVNYKAVVNERVSYLRKLVGLLGMHQPPEQVRALFTEPGQFPRPDELRQALDRLSSPQESERENGAPDGLTLTEPVATAQAVLALAERNGAAPDVSLAHSASPLGLVRVREETCTTCGSCAGACPTGALSIETRDEAVTLSYDPQLCIGCDRCVPACPEQDKDTLGVESVTDLAALAEGRVTLKRGSIALCKRCGNPVAPAAMLDKIRSLLEDADQSKTLLETVTELCPDCRGVQTTGA